ncbi:N-acylphosphatidylethanolamine-specific phospholipase D [Aureococcus anophagefferens]|nr:N-acylphosphatidylethanolamine-specific phospholipase D [Aureococcus anophagefferens]
MTDEAAIVATIDDAATSASLAVMDFSPASAYAQRGEAKASSSRGPPSPTRWRAVFARGVDAKLLVSWWPNTDAASLSYLAGLRRTARSRVPVQRNGTLEVKLFALPGWDALASYKYGPGLNGTYPAYTRVAHGKVVVTDRRANVGTSNWQWGYMDETAGASFNTGDAAFTASLQSAFDRDWASSYASPSTTSPRRARAACRGRDADGRAKCRPCRVLPSSGSIPATSPFPCLSGSPPFLALRGAPPGAGADPPRGPSAPAGSCPLLQLASGRAGRVCSGMRPPTLNHQ